MQPSFPNPRQPQMAPGLLWADLTAQDTMGWSRKSGRGLVQDTDLGEGYVLVTGQDSPKTSPTISLGLDWPEVLG
jgi:hypothetical protein